MFTTKGIGIGAGLITGAAGLTGIVGYSTGLFNSKELSNPNTQISELLNKENKYALLPISGNTHTADWETAWNKYKKDNENKPVGQDKWNLSGWRSDLTTMTSDFKNVCGRKSSEEVKNKSDQKYIDITNYCSRPKTLQEVLSQEGVTNLLSTENQDDTWRTKYEQYKNSDNKLPNVAEATSDDYTKLRDGCKKAVSLKTTEENYSQTYGPFKDWCLQ